MTEERLPLADLLAKAGDDDFLRSVAEAVVQLLMETDVEGLIGAGRHERTAERHTYRNGYRDRSLETRLGSLQLRIPKLRQGTLDPLRGSSSALPGAAQDDGEGAGGSDPRLSREADRRDRRRLYPPCGRAGAGNGAIRHQQEHGQQTLQRHRRPGECVSGASLGG